MRNALLVTLLALAPIHASALTETELESCWGSTSDLGGTFTQTMSDGSKANGSFYIQDASRMRMDYEQNFGARWVIGDGLLQQTSLRQGGVREIDHTQDLGPFASVFSTTPDFSRIVTGTGVGDQHTVVRARHPQAPKKGYIDFTFHNESCRLVQWNSTIEDFTHKSQFKY